MWKSNVKPKLDLYSPIPRFIINIGFLSEHCSKNMNIYHMYIHIYIYNFIEFGFDLAHSTSNIQHQTQQNQTQIIWISTQSTSKTLSLSLKRWIKTMALNPKWVWITNHNEFESQITMSLNHKSQVRLSQSVVRIIAGQGQSKFATP